MSDQVFHSTVPTEDRSELDRPAEYDVPPGAPVYECRYCGRPFARDSHLALHRGLEHPADLTDDEVDAFRTEHTDEEAALGTFRLKALGALVLLYFGLLMVYALV